MTLKEMREKRRNLVLQAREIVDRAEAEKRDLAQEESTTWDKVMAEVDSLTGQIDREERLGTIETNLNESRGTTAAGNEGTAEPGREEKRKAFVRFLRGGMAALNAAETRDLQADNDTAGGYVIPDQQFVAQLIKFVDNLVYVRQFATKMTLTHAESLGLPVLTTDISDSDWTSELATGSEDTAMAFGRRELRPHPLAKRIKVSNKLLRQGAIDVEQLVRDRLGYKFAVTQEKAFLTGTGTQQPLGVFVASADGISTGRDVATDNTTTAITADGLINAKYGLKAQYWPRARWIFHRDALKMIRKLKDSNGQYLWSDGQIGQAPLSAGQPATIVDIPYVLSEYAPNTFTTGKYVGIVGDFSFYQIVDALDMQIQRLVELYSEQNQVGFIGRMETDGAPVLEEAFVRVTLA